MTKRHVTTLLDGRIGIIQLNCDYAAPEKKRLLAKTLFELSRDGSDMLEHFDPAIHTFDALQQGILKHVPLTCWECEDTALPQDRYFRDAWEETGSVVQVNMPNARLIHMEWIRAARDVELEKESGSRHRQPPEIEAIFTPERQLRLQVLRDIPQTFDLTIYPTPETLKEAWPLTLSRPI